MKNKLTISDIAVKKINDHHELTAKIDDDRIYFRVTKYHDIFPVAEPFIGIALLEAMISNRDIMVQDTPISRELFNRLIEIQQIYSCWNKDLKVVEIIADTYKEIKPYKKVGCFFSAGVDSSHALLRNMDEISHLIIFNIFDYGNDDESWKHRINKQKKFADSINKTLIPVETNAREWTNSKKISWHFAHGLFLSSVGCAFGLSKAFVPSSHTYDELFPWGSHPLSDPMWSTESTKIIHDGAGFRRSEKLSDLLDNTLLADNLQTCWLYTDKNCGMCPKCVRSIIAIHILGKETSSLPSFKNKMLKSLRAIDESGATFLEDVMLLAKNHNPKLYKTLKRYYKQYQLKNILFSIDRYLLGNCMRNVYRKIKKPNWLDLRVSLRGMNRWNI